MSVALSPAEHVTIRSLIARVGAELLKRQKKGSFKVLQGSTEGPVTDADLWAQREILRGLKNVSPTAGIIAEEDGLGWGDALKGTDESVFTWVVDPIDGTRSFIAGEDTWGVQVALCQAGLPIGAWINLPAYPWGVDASEVSPLGFWGKQPQGASNGERIVIADGDFEEGHKLQLKASGIRYRGTRSCALDWASLTAGLVDAVAYRRARPWDHLPGVYLARRSGCVVTDWDRAPFRAGLDSRGILGVSSKAPAGFVPNFLPPDETSFFSARRGGE
ncbi:3'(2'),5'-bisphosphate nucleotidase CysQ [Austwickia sp. TVS 96-490-7B]|uniref:inositol monophosphatase family protein n=1 Tax=Austwickia sp. TVS 96-490-7B TaxID=2830843 RepID=UPI001C55AF44|nr:3'(2'),5'-bisphosphate nucleotidase CysQ [Austwickia sp. TVS 96-490-7B]